MYGPSEDPADIESVPLFVCLSHLEENAQSTAQLNSKRSKTMLAYVHSYCTSINSQSKSSVSQLVDIDQSLLRIGMDF